MPRRCHDPFTPNPVTARHGPSSAQMPVRPASISPIGRPAEPIPGAGTPTTTQAPARHMRRFGPRTALNLAPKSTSTHTVLSTQPGTVPLAPRAIPGDPNRAWRLDTWRVEFAGCHLEFRPLICKLLGLEKQPDLPQHRNNGPLPCPGCPWKMPRRCLKPASVHARSSA